MDRQLIVTLATGQRGKELLAITGPAMRRYAEKVGARFHAVTDPRLAVGWPHGAKFHIRKALTEGGYDRLVYLDADVLVAPDCPDLFEMVPATHAGLYDEGPDLIVNHARGNGPPPEWVNAEYAGVSPAVIGTIYRRRVSDPYYNAGIMVLSKAHAGVLDPPAGPVPFSHCAEQQVVNLNIVRLGVPVWPLPRACNWSWWYERDAWEAGPAHLYHAAGVDTIGVDGTATPHSNRLAMLRRTADRLYPNRGRCSYRSLEPVQFAGGCCGTDESLKAASHEYDCERFDARCCEGFGLLELSVMRCQTCPDHVSD